MNWGAVQTWIASEALYEAGKKKSKGRYVTIRLGAEISVTANETVAVGFSRLGDPYVVRTPYGKLPEKH